jgi:17beta-estradiol 17-dehydrogenase / very-long-chain 3-oxoacyl-CoA reductase
VSNRDSSTCNLWMQIDIVRYYDRLETWTENEVLSVIHLNAIFPLLFTRALLPQLRAAQGPTLVIFVGSISADIPMARFGIYASSKNFLEALARCLDADELWPAPTSGPSFMYLAVGNVVTNSTRTIPHLFNPTSERFAKAVVARIGCGRRRITPYMPHAIQQWCVTMIGESSVQRVIARELSNLLQENKKSE